MQGAANTFQNNLISGFTDLPCNVTVMNTLPFATFPNYKQLIMKTQKGKLLGFDNIEIGYVNLPIIKQFSRFLNYKKYVKEWLKNTKGEKCIIAYSLYLPFEKLFKYIKKHYPDVKTGLVCTDLPCEYGILPKNKVKAAIQYAYGKKTLDYARYCDCFAILTKAMKEPLNIERRPFTVIEGICNANLTEIKEETEEKTILYTGTLHKQFGILKLIEAFSLIEDPEYKLWICGGGDSKQAVIDAAQKDKRITFYGYLSKEEVQKLQQKATVLINPRNNDGEYTKYSFPSKTMEYMLSGKPVIMYKLDGVPDEYDSYLYYIGGNTADDIKKTILEVLNKSEKELESFGQKAAEFVSENKNSVVQAKRILTLLK